MSEFKSKSFFKHTILFSFLLTLVHLAFAQQADSTKSFSHFYAAVNVTNNGISLLPNFSLNKPAVLFNMAIGKKKLSFEPELRFAVEGGKPWSFLFWWRYKVVNTHKFAFNVGAHPAIAFREKTFMTTDGVSKNVLSAQRFFATELSPNYSVTKNINVGVYYLHAFGLETDVTKNTDFFAVRSSFSNIKLFKQFVLKVAPQFYYLKMDDKDGVYVSSTVTLAHKKSPFFISSIVSKTLKSEIGGKDFVWNVSLHYAFSKNYVKQ
jgi:hypothetical protein